MISSRKEDHVRLAVQGDVGFRNRTNGLDEVELPYNALPELNFDDIVVSTTFAGKQLSLPLIITGMTGGYPDAERINAGLAQCACDNGIALGVGSMRAAIEGGHSASFSVVRGAANYVPVISNIGAVQLAHWHRSGALADKVAEITSMINASVFGIHLNPLQEMLQPEGEPQFVGVTEAIAHTVEVSAIPVLVKEVGAGIRGSVASRLIAAGVTIIDVGGAGGTSWAGIEISRHEHQEPLHEYWDVGTPTAQCIREVAELKRKHNVQANGNHTPSTTTLVASGGIGGGGHIARAIALGADVCGSARPLLKAFERGGAQQLTSTIQQWGLDLRRWMFITGSHTVTELAGCLSKEL